MARRKATRRVKTANGAGGVTYNKTTKRWQARFSVRDPETGETLRRTLYGSDEQSARAKLVDALKARQDGALVVTRGRAPTIESYASSWLTAREGRVRVRSLARYAELLKRHIIPALGKTQLRAVTPQMVERVMTNMIRQGLSARTANYARATLRAMLASAMKDGHVSRNVAGLADPLPQPDRQVRVLTPEEIELLLKSAATDTVGTLWITSLATGCRQGELLGLTWGAVDLDAAEVEIRRTLQYQSGVGFLDQPPKTDKSRRVIALPQIAVEALRDQKRRQREARLLAGGKWSTEYGDLVFSKEDGTPYRGTAISQLWSRRLATLGLPHMKFHGLRHSAASLLIAQGESLFNVSRSLGHSSINITADVYGHLMPDARKGIASAMDRALRRG